MGSMPIGDVTAEADSGPSRVQFRDDAGKKTPLTFGPGLSVAWGTGQLGIERIEKEEGGVRALA